MILFQYAEDSGPITLHEVFNHKISDTLNLFERICNDTVVGFNLTHDWFHIVKMYNILRVLYDAGYNNIPTVDYVAELELLNPSNWCLRPRRAVDLMLLARRTKYQGTLGHPDIVVRRVPKVLSDAVTKELTSRISLHPINFARRSKGYSWEVQEIEDSQFCNIVLRFGGSTSLGEICKAEFNEDKADWPIPESMFPQEVEWKPYGGNWPELIYSHIAMWENNSQARYYAERDVILTRRLGQHWQHLITEDTYIDGQLACLVGAARWRGYAIDQGKISELIDKYSLEVNVAPKAPRQALAYLHAGMSSVERKLVTSTSKDVLNELKEWEGETGIRAQAVIAARRAEKRLDILNKLKQLKAFHPTFKIIGTRSNRMAGGSEEGKSESINPQGIPRGKEFRSIFTMAFSGEELWGGDAKSFEVTIMDAVWGDETLHLELLSGLKFHGLWGSTFLNTPYEQIMSDEELYSRIKSADFGWGYGAQPPKVAKVLDVPLEVAERGFIRIENKYTGIRKAREQTINDFCSMTQPGGIGTAVVWKDPAEYVESIFGFKRFFTLDNIVCKGLFDLANNLPKSFREFNDIKLTRRERVQTPAGATQSALFAAAFNIQSQVLRQANNHKIQSPGAHITKMFQYELWNLQPIGVHCWVVRPMNIHDEILNPQSPTVNTVEIRNTVIERYRKRVPLLDWEWKPMKNWSSK